MNFWSTETIVRVLVTVSVVVLVTGVASSVLDSFNQDDARHGEVWWATTDCPPGVEVPSCLDSTMSIHDVPEWAGGTR